MSLRRRLTLGIALTAAVLGVALAGRVGSPAAAPPAQANGNAVGNLGLVGMDHVGITVPDIDEAIAWFEDVVGCSAPLTFGPFSDPVGTFMQDLLGVHPGAVIEQITLVRCGDGPSIELFQYTSPDQDQTFRKNSLPSFRAIHSITSACSAQLAVTHSRESSNGMVTARKNAASPMKLTSSSRSTTFRRKKKYTCAV